MSGHNILVIELVGVFCSGKTSSQEKIINNLQKEYPDMKKAQEAIDLYINNLTFVKLSCRFPNFIYNLIKINIFYIYYISRNSCKVYISCVCVCLNGYDGKALLLLLFNSNFGI